MLSAVCTELFLFNEDSGSEPSNYEQSSISEIT